MSNQKSSSLKGELLSKLIRSANKDQDLDIDNLPNKIYLLPVTERPFFPAQTLPMIMNEKFWLPSMQAMTKEKSKLGGMIMTLSDSADNLKPQTFALTGTLARIHHPLRSSKKVQFIAEGIRRFRVTNFLTTTPPFLVEVEYPETIALDDKEELYKGYAANIISTLKEMMRHNPGHNEELKFFLNRFTANEPSAMSDFAAGLTSANAGELQSVLDLHHLDRRMDRVLYLVKKELEMVKIQAQIRQDVEAKLSEHQRKFFLKEQLKVIQKELGIAKDDKTADIERLRARIDKLTLSEEANKKAETEFDKLAILEPGSSEYASTRNYLDTLTQLPWGKSTTDNLDIEQVRKTLDGAHEGLDDVKDRLLEFISVGKLTQSISGSVILLIGPPGVGKTSIGRAIANSLGRNFYRFSVGGLRDESEIKGHRRTYVGAMPGKLIQAMKDAGSENPVIMLDEIDKLGRSHQGDPAAALLEVLDPEQNHEFLDHYLDVRFDLSKVLFVCTANQLDTIPQPLLDRMEVMRLSGYLTEEKVSIANKHLWPRLLEKNGLKKSQVSIGSSTFKAVAEGYARESGVRNMEKQLAKIVRKCATKVAAGNKKKISIKPDDLPKYLGRASFSGDEKKHGVGIVTGLAWTAMGGATLYIESSRVHQMGRGLKLTGKLGEVMQESANIAYSYLLSHLEHYDIAPSFFAESLVHLHVPAGATPKDGPSAGITMATALVSLAKNRPIRKKVGMTGELTLTGEVLAVGGIREKLVAAKRIKIKEVILPKACESDYEDLPESVKKGLTVHFVGHYDEVFEILFP